MKTRGVGRNGNGSSRALGLVGNDQNYRGKSPASGHVNSSIGDYHVLPRGIGRALVYPLQF